MMGRHNGYWSPIYEQAWDHEKTSRAVAWLREQDRRVTEEVAPFLVLGWLNRLCLWCLRASERGVTGGLDNARLATIAWPQSVDRRKASAAGSIVRGALRAGGFLEGDADGERIHDFTDHHRRMLKDRERKRGDEDEGPESPDDFRGTSAEPPRTIRGHSAATGSESTGSDRTGEKGGDARAREDAPRRTPEPPPASLRSPEPDQAPEAALEDRVGYHAAKLREAIGEASDRVARTVIAELIALGADDDWLARKVNAFAGQAVGGYAWKALVAPELKAAKVDPRDFGVRSPDSGGERQRRALAEHQATVERLAPLADAGTITPRDQRALREAQDEIPRLESYLAALSVRTVPAHRERREPKTCRPRLSPHRVDCRA